MFSATCFIVCIAVQAAPSAAQPSLSLARRGGASGGDGGGGEVQWRFRVPDYVLIQFVEVGPDGAVYTAGGEATYALNPDGTLRWASAEASGGYPISLGEDGAVYTASDPQRRALVIALNPDGTLRWRFFAQPGSRLDLVGPNVGPDGNIYGVQGHVDGGGLGVFSLDPEGRLVWSNPGEPPIGALDSFNTRSDIVFGVDRLHAGVVGLRSGGNPFIDTYSLEGERLWSTRDVQIHTTSFPVMDPQHRVICTWGQTGMRAFAAGGKEEWVTLHPSGASVVKRPAVDAAGAIYSGDFISVDLWALNPDGTVRWVAPREFPHTLGELGISPDGRVLVAQGTGGFGADGWVRGYDPEDGSLLWQVDLPAENGAPQLASSFEPVFSPDSCTVYVTTHFAGSVNDYGYLLAIRAQECGPTPGDTNCDGVIDSFDIEPFVLALSDPNGYMARFPGCDVSSADVNGDGAVDAFDVEPFIALLVGP